MRETIFKFFVVTALAVLAVSVFLLYQETKNLQSLSKPEDIVNQKAVDAFEENLESDTQESSDIQAQLDALKAYFDQALATVSATKPTVSIPSQKQELQTTYIPLGTTFKTSSTNWVDVTDSGAYIDIENDYGQNAYIEWEAYLSVAHGNGQVFARLWDDTNKIAVAGSELTSINNSTAKLVISPRIYLWRGRNLYKVQIKSLNGFEVTYSSGRMKISY